MLEYRLGQALPFHLMNGEPARESGVAVLKSDGETLFLTAVMTDSDIFNRAEKNNEETFAIPRIMIDKLGPQVSMRYTSPVEDFYYTGWTNSTARGTSEEDPVRG